LLAQQLDPTSPYRLTEVRRTFQKLGHARSSTTNTRSDIHAHLLDSKKRRFGTFFTLCSVLFAKQATAYFPSGACLLDYFGCLVVSSPTKISLRNGGNLHGIFHSTLHIQHIESTRSGEHTTSLLARLLSQSPSHRAESDRICTSAAKQTQRLLYGARHRRQKGVVLIYFRGSLLEVRD
jgi:hypothetical protein